MQIKKVFIVCVLLANSIAIFARSSAVELQGTWKHDFHMSSEIVTITGGDIVNKNNGGTHHLKLTVMFSENPYSGGTFYGYKIAEKDVGYLASDEIKSNPSYYMNFEKKLPKSGSYYVTVLLQELVGSRGYGIVDYLVWKYPVDFTNQTDEKAKDLLHELKFVKSQIEFYQNEPKRPHSQNVPIDIILDRNMNSLQQYIEWSSKELDIKRELRYLGYHVDRYPHEQYFAEKTSVNLYSDIP